MLKSDGALVAGRVIDIFDPLYTSAEPHWVPRLGQQYVLYLSSTVSTGEVRRRRISLDRGADEIVDLHATYSTVDATYGGAVAVSALPIKLGTLRASINAAMGPTASVTAGSRANVKSACGWSALWSPVDLAPGTKLVPPRKTRDVPVQWPQDPLGASSRRRGKGTPLAELLIDPRGRVVDARLVRRATWEPAWPEADAALLEAVRQWEFQPATVSGEPVQACLTMSIDVHWR